VAPAVSTGGSFTGVTLMVLVTGALEAVPSVAIQVTVRCNDEGACDVF
jgi:hypothetical protein